MLNQLKEKTRSLLLPLALIAVIVITNLLHIDHTRSKAPVSASGNAIIMGSAFSLTLYEDAGKLSGDADEMKEQLRMEADRMLGLIDTLDREVLSWRSENSEVFRFNHSEASGPFAVSPALADAVREAIPIAEQSGGAVDITLRPVIGLWGIETWDGRSAFVPPSEEALKQTAARTGLQHLTVNEGTDGQPSLTKNIPDLALDLGAFGKGYALDLAAEELKSTGADGALLAAGGSILTYGDKEEDWQIGIRDPEGSPADLMAVIKVKGEAKKTTFISTSGGYEKYAEADGKIYEHIIDGRTMHPAENDLYSVTVVTPDSGLASDGLSTACYILGPEASKALLGQYHAEAVFVTRDRTVYLTDGLIGLVTLTNSDYRLEKLP